MHRESPGGDGEIRRRVERLAAELFRAKEPRRRPAMPPLGRIAMAWAALPPEELEATFPRLKAFWIGWGEPFCFRCGWLPPVPDSPCYPRGGSRAAWNRVEGHLQRAHLRDVMFGGGNEPLDMAPLCRPCHAVQGLCETREQGIAYIRGDA